jgi:DNA-binding transcriptional regulator GbsR (MarR family)
MNKIQKTVSLAQKIVSEAKNELNKERESKLKAEAKRLLEDIQESKRTVDLLEKQLRNFMREVEIGEK